MLKSLGIFIFKNLLIILNFFFRDLTQFIKWKTKKFDKENYFNSFYESDLDFYKQVFRIFK